jgi:uncharacterized protein
MMRMLSCAVALLAMLHLPSVALGAASDDEEKVVYHVDDMAAAREALYNIANHLAASPMAEIVLVANGKGIFLLIAGEKDRQGPYSNAITALQLQGVRFEVCRNSLNSRNIDPKSLLPKVQIVTSGVAELTRLQLREKYAYIKP